MVGSEERGKGVDVNLGPTVNIVRDPRWGRAFESYGEDPICPARRRSVDISGVQSQGVMAMVKHWAVYNQETNRNTPADDALVSQRTMHEIYMPQFEAAVTQGHAASVMCSYSTINGQYACQNRYLRTCSTGSGAPRLRDLGLGRDPLDGAVGAGRAGHADARRSSARTTTARR